MEIKPCPFCGSEKVNVGTHGNNLYACCYSCNSCGPYGISKEEAIERWNSAPRKEDVEMEKNCGNCKHISEEVEGKVYCGREIGNPEGYVCDSWEAKEPKSTPLNAENPSGLKTLCEKAISKWGEAAQINKAIEELLELAIALTRYQNLNLRDEDYQEKAYKILDNIHEEREDVEIMLRQLDVIFGRSEEWQRKKYAHLRLIVEDTENE